MIRQKMLSEVLSRVPFAGELKENLVPTSPSLCSQGQPQEHHLPNRLMKSWGDPGLTTWNGHSSQRQLGSESPGCHTEPELLTTRGQPMDPVGPLLQTASDLDPQLTGNVAKQKRKKNTPCQELPRPSQQC